MHGNDSATIGRSWRIRTFRIRIRSIKRETYDPRDRTEGVNMLCCSTVEDKDSLGGLIGFHFAHQTTLPCSCRTNNLISLKA